MIVKVLVSNIRSAQGIYFYINCEHSKGDILMQRNFVSEEGVFRNKVQLHKMCSLTTRREYAKIAFHDNVHILLDRKTNKMVTTGGWGLSNTLASIGTRSQISLDWEIFGSFFSQNKGSLQKQNL